MRWLCDAKICMLLANRGGAVRVGRRYYFSMKAKSQKVPHKLGANQKEPAVRSHPTDANFKQSRDVREDRGERQIKTTRARQTLRG